MSGPDRPGVPTGVLGLGADSIVVLVLYAVGVAGPFAVARGE